MWCYHCHGRRTYVWFWWQAQRTQFVYRFQDLNLNPIYYLRFTNCYGKINKEGHGLTYWHKIWHRLFDSVPIKNIFYRHVAIFEIPIWCFISKPPACWGTELSIEIYQLLLLFRITSPWKYLGMKWYLYRLNKNRVNGN